MGEFQAKVANSLASCKVQPRGHWPLGYGCKSHVLLESRIMLWLYLRGVRSWICTYVVKGPPSLLLERSFKTFHYNFHLVIRVVTSSKPFVLGYLLLTCTCCTPFVDNPHPWMRASVRGSLVSISWSNIHGWHWQIHGWGVSGHDEK